jgi:hypothetical protein
MINLNFSNVEELIFYDIEAQKILGNDMYSIFEQWKMSKRIPYLKSIGQQAILDFLNTITESQVEILENYFGKKIFIEKLNYELVKNLKISIEKKDICDELCKIEGYSYYTSFRDDNHIYLTFWK